jgi:hypothetical protein
MTVAAECEQQISASDRDTQIAGARNQPQSIHTRRVVSHHRKIPMGIPRPIEECAEGFQTASSARDVTAFRPSGPAAARLSLHATGRGRGTRAPDHTHGRRCRLHRATHRPAVYSTRPHDRWRGVRDMRTDRLVLRATLPWRRRHVSVNPCNAAGGDFHLGHGRGAMFTAQPRCAAGHQLLGAKRRHNRELVGVQMRWP